jgi:hypothetical protein
MPWSRRACIQPCSNASACGCRLLTSRTTCGAKRSSTTMSIFTAPASAVSLSHCCLRKPGETVGQIFINARFCGDFHGFCPASVSCGPRLPPALRRPSSPLLRVLHIPRRGLSFARLGNRLFPHTVRSCGSTPFRTSSETKPPCPLRRGFSLLWASRAVLPCARRKNVDLAYPDMLVPQSLLAGLFLWSAAPFYDAKPRDSAVSEHACSRGVSRAGQVNFLNGYAGRNMQG